MFFPPSLQPKNIFLCKQKSFERHKKLSTKLLQPLNEVQPRFRFFSWRHFFQNLPFISFVHLDYSALNLANQFELLLVALATKNTKEPSSVNGDDVFPPLIILIAKDHNQPLNGHEMTHILRQTFVRQTLANILFLLHLIFTGRCRNNLHLK